MIHISIVNGFTFKKKCSWGGATLSIFLKMIFDHMLHGVGMLLNRPAPCCVHVHTAYIMVPHGLIFNLCTEGIWHLSILLVGISNLHANLKTSSNMISLSWMRYQMSTHRKPIVSINLYHLQPPYKPIEPPWNLLESPWFDLQDLLSSFDPLTAPAGVAAPGNLFRQVLSRHSGDVLTTWDRMIWF